MTKLVPRIFFPDVSLLIRFLFKPEIAFPTHLMFYFVIKSNADIASRQGIEKCLLKY